MSLPSCWQRQQLPALSFGVVEEDSLDEQLRTVKSKDFSHEMTSQKIFKLICSAWVSSEFLKMTRQQPTQE